MDRGQGSLSDERVVPLGVEPPSEEPPPSLPTSRLHSAAVFASALFALLGIGSWLAFVTVNWSGTPRRIVIAVTLFSVVGFLAAVAITVFSAARDTYVRSDRN